jgi:mono/diheme cytochrome c family protein
MRAGTEGQGGEHFGREIGLPGDVYARNITPAALGDWTDGEILRAMTSGVSRDGTALFPLMPYPNYRHLCDRDAAALVSYVRALEPIEHEVPERELDFPLNLIVRTIPAAAEPWSCPTPSDGVRYGEYLTTLASCGDCHTPRKGNEPDPSKAFAGGLEFPLPKGGVARSANLTAHATGLGSWSKEAFVQRFRVMAQPGAATQVAPGGFNTPMPWTLFGGMTEQDLGAIYDYLRTLPPVENRVEKFTAAP